MQMPENEESRDRFSIRFGRLNGRSDATRLCAAVLTTGIAAIALSHEKVSVSLAVVVLSACVANAGRIAIHVFGGDYLVLSRAELHASPFPKARKYLNVLILANIALTMLGLAGGAMLIVHPDAPLLCRVLPVCVLCGAFFLVALATVDRAGVLKLKRGTEIVRESDFGKWLFKIGRTGSRFKPVKLLLDLFDKPTPLGEPSVLALLIAGALLLGPVSTVEAELNLAAKGVVSRWVEDGSKQQESGGNKGTTPSPRAQSPNTQPNEAHPRTSQPDGPSGGTSRFQVPWGLGNVLARALAMLSPDPHHQPPAHMHETFTIKIVVQGPGSVDCEAARMKSMRSHC